MVFDKVFQPYWIEKRPIYSLYLGLIFSTVGFVTAFILFKDVLGLAAIFFTVMLALPSINSLLKYEEYLELESHESFFKRHENIFDIYLYFFIGVFLVFFVIGLINTTFLYNAGIVIQPSSVGAATISKEPLLHLNMGKVYSIILNNIFVMIVAFVLSLFYGAGSLFLIIFNTSVWSSVLAQVVKLKAPAAGLFPKLLFGLCNLSVMFIHTVPEMAAYLVAAIGGGVLSKAFVKEGIHSDNFHKVLKDSLILLGIAVLITIVSGFIEMGISEKLFSRNVCASNQFGLIFVGAIIVIGVLILEYFRHKHKKKHANVLPPSKDLPKE